MLYTSLLAALLMQTAAADDMPERTALAEALVDATKQAQFLEVQTEFGFEQMGDAVPEGQREAMAELTQLQHEAMIRSMVRALSESYTVEELEKGLAEANATQFSTDLLLDAHKLFLQYITEESQALMVESQAIFQEMQADTEEPEAQEPEPMMDPVAPVERTTGDFLPMTVGAEIAFELDEDEVHWGEEVRVPVTDAELMTVFNDMSAQLVSLEGSTRVSELSGLRAYSSMAQCNDALWLIKSRLTHFVADGDTPCGHSKLLNPANNQQAWLRCKTAEQMGHAELSFRMKHVPTSDAFQEKQQAYFEEQMAEHEERVEE